MKSDRKNYTCVNMWLEKKNGETRCNISNYF